jgi:hypothetical protein
MDLRTMRDLVGPKRLDIRSFVADAIFCDDPLAAEIVLK